MFDILLELDRCFFKAVQFSFKIFCVHKYYFFYVKALKMFEFRKSDPFFERKNLEKNH